MTIQSAPVGPGSITGYIKARYKPRNTRGNFKTVEEDKVGFSRRILACVLAKPPLDLCEELWRNFITAVSLDTPNAATTFVVLDQSTACLLKLAQSLLPCIDRVIFSLGQRFPSEIVFAWNFGRVEVRVVYPAGRFMHPARGDPRENDRGGCNELHDKVDGD